jgi:hypothetical protein
VSDVITVIEQQVAALIANYKAAMADGFQWRDLVTLYNEVIPAIVAIVEALPATGEQKKRAALDCLDRFYAAVIEPLDIPGVPDILVDKPLGLLLHLVAEFAIDWAVARFNREGWPKV